MVQMFALRESLRQRLVRRGLFLFFSRWEREKECRRFSRRAGNGLGVSQETPTLSK